MKKYVIEPTYKKSVIETIIFNRPLSDLTGDDEHENKKAYVEKEIGWRWGSWIVDVPETDEEMKNFIEHWFGNNEYETIEDFLEDYYPEALEDDELDLAKYLLPPTAEGDDYIELSEDYPWAEMNDVWDGCWEDWSMGTGHNGPKLADVDEMIEEIEDAYNEEYEEGVEALGWTFVDCGYVISCRVTVKPYNPDEENV